MTNYYDLPITLYGLGTKIGSRKLYERNGFSLIDDSYQFVVRDRNSSLLKSPIFSSRKRLYRRITNKRNSRRFTSKRNTL